MILKKVNGARRAMNKFHDQLLTEIANQFYKGKADLFVGSGISSESGLPGWYALLQPLAKEIGIEIEKDDDLPEIAQYIVNAYIGNKSVLLRHIQRELKQKWKLNKFHYGIRQIKLSTIWTTNFDGLLENCFSDMLLDIKISDADIPKYVYDSKVEIIKLHGCINHSAPDDIVITNDDYADFFVKRPATAQRLTNDLLQKTFLFIGYSYNDPNIRNIMTTARRMSKNLTQRHFIILKEVEDGSREKVIQNLWIQDLKRYGVTALLIKEYDELYEILSIIGQRSRGNTVYITGSHLYSGNEIEAVGKDLAGIERITLVNGQADGVNAVASNSFIRQCISEQKELSERVLIFPNPYAANPLFSNDPTLLPQLKEERKKLFGSTQVVLIFSGGMGTKTELEAAIEMNCYIIPVIINASDYNNEVIKLIIENERIMDSLNVHCSQYYQKLISGEITINIVISAVRKVLMCVGEIKE